MRRSAVLAVMVALLSVPTFAEGEVRFFENGELRVGCVVGVVPHDPVHSPEKLPPSPDGVYLLAFDPGSKATLEVTCGGVRYVPSVVSFPETLAGAVDVDLVRQADNDLCEDATWVSVPSVTAGSTVGAVPDNARLCVTEITSPGVWYRVVGTGHVTTASTCNDGDPATGSANFDTKITVYCGGCDVLWCVGANDDGPGCAEYSSKIEFCSELGAEYLILVHGFSGATGDFELAVIDEGTPCSPTTHCFPGPPPIDGACCTCLPPAFDCSVMTPEECLAHEGEFQGLDTWCTPDVENQSAPGLYIPDGTGVFVADTITVADVGIVNDVNVAPVIAHSWVGDLVIDLEHDGVRQTLWDRQCGSADYIRSTADDGTDATCAEITAGPLWDVRWPPDVYGHGPLSVFNGLDVGGDWTLLVSDHAAGDLGFLKSWRLQFNDEMLDTICSAEEEDDSHVTICHYPPGNPTNARTITVGASAVDAHVAQHGDSLGPCDE